MKEIPRRRKPELTEPCIKYFKPASSDCKESFLDAAKRYVE